MCVCVRLPCTDTAKHVSEAGVPAFTATSECGLLPVTGRLHVFRVDPSVGLGCDAGVLICVSMLVCETGTFICLPISRRSSSVTFKSVCPFSCGVVYLLLICRSSLYIYTFWTQAFDALLHVCIANTPTRPFSSGCDVRSFCLYFRLHTVLRALLCTILA